MSLIKRKWEYGQIDIHKDEHSKGEIRINDQQSKLKRNRFLPCIKGAEGAVKLRAAM